MIFILSLILAFPNAAVPAPEDLRDPGFMIRAQAGFEDIFNMDYAKAEGVFDSLARDYPRHPAPALYRACILWLEELLRREDLSLDRFIDPSYFAARTDLSMPPRDRAAFFDYLQKSENLAGAILKANGRDKDARYLMGTCHGLRSSFAITIDHNVREAFSSGRQAFVISRDLVAEDPNYYDAYMPVGIYEYIVGSVPWYMRWMAFVMGLRGSRAQGIEHLQVAAAKGQYVRNEARLVAMVLDARERRYPEALEIAQDLCGRFPRNYIFPLNVARMLAWTGRKDQAIATLVSVDRKAEGREPNFDKALPGPLHFTLGVELMNLSRIDLAEQQFVKALRDPKLPQRDYALSHLRLAKIYRWQGLRGDAAAECRIVLALPDVEQSHSQARRILSGR